MPRENGCKDPIGDIKLAVAGCIKLSQIYWLQSKEFCRTQTHTYRKQTQTDRL